MLKNYLVIAIRNITRNKVFTFINVLGLAIGITIAITIYLLVRHDYSFDNFHKDGDRIYRVVSQFEFSKEKFYNSGVTMPLAKAISGNLPEIEYTVPIYTFSSDTKISINDAKKSVHRNQTNAIYAHSDYFKIFSYEWLAGDEGSALDEPYQAVLSQTKAEQFFPKEPFINIPGKKITIDDSIHCTVTGIVKSFKENTDITFEVFVSFPTFKMSADLADWGSTTSSSQLFVKIHKGQDTKALEKKLQQVLIKNAPPKPEAAQDVAPFLLQPLKEIHFDPRFGTFFDNRLASKTKLYGLMIVAIFILLLGCINFINMSTAQSGQRSKEIGIRKTMGSSRNQLIVQFLAEIFVLTLVAAIISMLSTPFVLKSLSEFVPAGVRFNPLQEPGIILFLVGLIVLVSLLAGFYPALVLSAYKPALVMKARANVTSGSAKGLSLRRTLTVFQFVIAQFFIIAVVMVTVQLSYSVNKDPGFKKEGIVFFGVNFLDTSTSKKQILHERIKMIPGVSLVSLSNTSAAANGTWSSTIKYKDGGKENETSVQMKMGDTNYIKLYELKLLAGRNITASDTIRELIINDTYRKVLGFKFPGDAIGKYIEWDERQVPIVGVAADFHQQSMHNLIKPLAISSMAINHRTFNIALAHGSDWPGIIKKIEKLFKELYPEDDFELSYQDETIKKYYDDERRTSFLMKMASVLMIVISCLGLLGLAIYSIARRTKEIGIRKVLGASVSQIVRLISKESILLVSLAFVIAVPIAYYAITLWLENFAYRAPMEWWMFAISFFFQLIVAFITVGSQALRVALINPATTLKTE